jgi:DNA-binding transcriptional LysR family regulator
MEAGDRLGRRFKLRDLHTFFAVAQRGSMAKAARELALTQPAVTKAIADLESTVGARLFDRTPQGIELTPYGAALRKWGAAVFDDLEHAIKEIRFLADPTAGELRLGCNDPLAGGLVPAVIDDLTKEYPRVVFDVTQFPQTTLMLRQLRERTIDVGMGRLVATDEQDLQTEVLFEDPLVIAVGERSRWARRRSVKLADLVDEPWTMPPPSISAGSVIAETFRSFGLQFPPRRVFSHSVHMQVALVAAGRYVSVLPASFLRFASKRTGIRVLPIELKLRPAPVGIVTLKNRSPSSVASLFVERVRAAVKTQKLGF